MARLDPPGCPGETPVLQEPLRAARKASSYEGVWRLRCPSLTLSPASTTKAVAPKSSTKQAPRRASIRAPSSLNNEGGKPNILSLHWQVRCPSLTLSHASTTTAVAPKSNTKNAIMVLVCCYSAAIMSLFWLCFNAIMLLFCCYYDPVLVNSASLVLVWQHHSSTSKC